MMVKTSGDAIIRAKTEDYKEWQFLEADGETPVSLEGATRVMLRLKEVSTGTITEHATDDDPILLEMLVPLADGKVRLKPASTTFPSATTYIFHFWITDAGGKKIPIPEGVDGTLKVIEDYPIPSP